MAYRTEQKEALTAFLEKNAERQYTAAELANELTHSAPIGASTVYRLLGTLLSEGRVRRFTIGGGRQFFYQYIVGEACGSHLHLKCTACGRLYHLDASVSEFMQKQILATSRFALDENQTLLFGTCYRCRGRNLCSM